MKDGKKYSIVIPVLNEEEHISECIAEIRKIKPDVEIIVVDGYSIDNTVAIAFANGVLTCFSSRGRGIQCNTGAGIASGDILVFLHVDTRLPNNTFSLLDKAFKNKEVRFGVFKLSFDVNHWLLNIYPYLLRINLPFLRFGDQCIVIRKNFFRFLGGFPEWALFEDSGIARKASRYTRIHVFPGTVVTSSRRFVQNGVISQLLRDVVYLLLYLIGTDPGRLADRYDKTDRHTSSALIALARKPQEGKVKTRLSIAIGAKTATRIYSICARNAFRAMKGIGGNVIRYVFYTCDGDHNIRDLRKLVGSTFYFVQQKGSNLGEILIHVFHKAFGHGAGRVVVIATDVPDISSYIIKLGIESLNDHDIVIGPAPDGGYYLIGMNRLYEELFRDIDWGSSRVLEKTLAISDSLGLSTFMLPELLDIDTEEDLYHWMEMGNRNHCLYRFLRNRLPKEKKFETDTKTNQPEPII